MEILSRLLKTMLDFALPPRCPICGATVESDNRFCLSCWQSLDFLNEPWCSSCGRPFAFEQGEGAQCVSCLRKRPKHDGVRAVVAYDDKSSLLPMRLKYGARLGLAELIAQQLVRFLDDVPSDALIIPVPLHRLRLWSRGFNQAVLIGRALSAHSGLVMRTDILIRKKATPPLRSMSAKQRSNIVRNAFSLSRDGECGLKEKAVVLVDDVYTTGSTANACAETLKKSGVSSVMVFCWARVLKDDEQS